MEVMQTRHLDATSVRPSRWTNRHESSYEGKAFRSLKLEIANAGGNIQPIKVREVPGGAFEIVFGHRRHRACLELGLSVLATVVAMDDRTLWEEMERENRLRADLAPHEQGLRYKAALDAGLYPTIRRMAEAVGADFSQVAKVIKLAELPEDVIRAFKSPSDLQVNWAPALHAAHQQNPKSVIARARRVREVAAPDYRAKDIFLALTAGKAVEPFHAKQVKIAGADGMQLAVISQSKSGYKITINATDLPLSSVEAALRRLLNT